MSKLGVKKYMYIYSHPAVGQSFSLSLCGPISISRANQRSHG